MGQLEDALGRIESKVDRLLAHFPVTAPPLSPSPPRRCPSGDTAEEPLRWVNTSQIDIVQGGTYPLAADVVNETGDDEDYGTAVGGLPSGVTIDEETGLMSAAADAAVGAFDGWQGLVFTEDDPPPDPPVNNPPVWTGSSILTFTLGQPQTIVVRGNLVTDAETPTTFSIILLSIHASLAGLGITWDSGQAEIEYDGSAVAGQTISSAIALRADDGVNIADKTFSIALVDATAQHIIPPELFYPSEGSPGGTKSSELHDGMVNWATPGGDWKDKNGTSQGVTPYATAQILDNNTEQTLTWTSSDLTQLVADWGNGALHNWGMLLKITASGSGPSIRFHSKQNTVGAAIPKLIINGTIDVPVTSDTWMSGSDSTAGQSTAVRVESGNRNAVLWFDLSGFAPGSITSASLEMRSTNVQFGGTTTIGIFRVDLSDYQTALPFEAGIANSFTNDVGLAAHADVVFYEDYATYPIGQSTSTEALMEGRGWRDILNICDPGDNRSIVGDTDPANPSYAPLFPGKRAIKASLLPAPNPEDGFGTGKWQFIENLGSIWEAYNAARGNPGHPHEPEEMYFRYYVRLGENWDPAPTGGKILGLWSNYNVSSDHKPGYVPIWGGNSGLLTWGCSGWTRRGGFSNINSSGPSLPAISSPLLLAGYRRFFTIAEDWRSTREGANDGTGVGWRGPNGHHTAGLLRKGVWHCIEKRIRMNSIDTSGVTKAYVGYPWGTYNLFLDPAANAEKWQREFGLGDPVEQYGGGVRVSRVRGGSANTIQVDPRQEQVVVIPAPVAVDTFSASIRIDALTVGPARRFSWFKATGNWVGTITLQRSADGVTGWTDRASYTNPQATVGELFSGDDGQTGTTWFYRIGVKAGGLSSGTATASLIHATFDSTWGLVNFAIWVTTRPNEKRRVIAWDNATGTATISEYNGGSTTWDTVPADGEQFQCQKNVFMQELTSLWFGNETGQVYANGNAIPRSGHEGTANRLDTALIHTAGVGRYDGIDQQWVDGRLVMDQQTELFRHIPEIQIVEMFGGSFMGGSGVTPTQQNDIYYTAMALSKNYIGPIGGL